MTLRRWRILRAVLLALLALGLIAFAAAWWLLAGSRAQLDGQLKLPGLEASVSIKRDTLGTVTIEAATAPTSVTPWVMCTRRSVSSRWI